MDAEQMARLAQRVRSRAGCGRTCAVSVAPARFSAASLAYAYVLRHNGVSFAHAASFLNVFLPIDEGKQEDALVLWMQAHHAGRHEREMHLKLDDGTVAIVAEIEG